MSKKETAYFLSSVLPTLGYVNYDVNLENQSRNHK